MLALFEANDEAGHPMIPQKTGVAFSVDFATFAAFTRSLPGQIDTSWGTKLKPDDVVDLDMCWAYDLADPWGNIYELNCYEYERVQTDLIEAHDISPRRHWPAELYAAWNS